MSMFVEQKDNFTPKKYITGPVVVNNILINPTLAEAREYGIGWMQDEPVYVGEAEYDGKTKKYVDIVVYAKPVDDDTVDPLNWKFRLVQGDRLSRTGKIQYINHKGVTSWVEKEEDLPDWFKGGEYRKALQGEEELYKFIIAFNNFNVGQFESTDSVIESIDSLKMLFAGNFNDLKFANTLTDNKIQVIASVITKEASDKDGNAVTRYYQQVWNKEFFRHWETTPYLYEGKDSEGKVKKGRVEWDYYIDYIVNADPNNRFDPDVITDTPKVWATKEELRLEIENNVGKTPQDLADKAPEATDDLPF